ncbi:MAG: VOC family protein [Saprospiraceae bacterium]|nr:VOC family protein [Pyrinomonadaceae bacterium]
MEIPKGHQAVMPYLMMENAKAFIEFTKTVFDAELTHHSVNDDGLVGHCEINIGGSTIMFSNSRGEWGPATGNMFVYVEDADKTYQTAVFEGAVKIMEPADQDYGRSCGVTDPFGNVWWITSVNGKGGAQ